MVLNIRSVRSLACVAALVTAVASTIQLSAVQAVPAQEARPKFADALEPDNMPEQALVDRYNDFDNIHHNFYDQGDQDWILVWIPGGVEVTFISINTISPDCKPTIEIYGRRANGTLRFWELHTSTNGSDTFKFYFRPADSVNGGTYYVRVYNSTGVFGDNTDYDISIFGNADPSAIGALAGVVMNSNETPIANATVRTERLGATSTSTDGDGIYTFAALPQQTYKVIARADGFADEFNYVTIEQGIKTLDFELESLHVEDLDDNGQVNAVDVQIVINAALGLPGAMNGDVNGSGSTNAIDVQLVINAALGL
jgi:hypothetical protein